MIQLPDQLRMALLTQQNYAVRAEGVYPYVTLQGECANALLLILRELN